MFEGLIQLQLPFILISSGISSGLYLLFLFFNIGQPTEQIESKINSDAFTLEVSSDTHNQDYEISFQDYYNQLIIGTKKINNNLELQVKENKPIKCRSFQRAYSFHFAQASFCRPPPTC